MKKQILRSLYYFPRILSKKEFVFIISSQRSGSTLLKSLLANAPDVSHLPEIPIQKYGKWNTWQLKTLSSRRIIVLKKPSFANQFDYPKLPPVSNQKIILLIRNPHDTLLSVYRMFEKIDKDFTKNWDYRKLLTEYWLPTYESIRTKQIKEQPNTFLVKYEDLIKEPINMTKELFQFIGSVEKNGMDTYNRPDNFKWKWFSDDSGEKIKSLKVQRKKGEEINEELKALISNSSRTQSILQYFGYTD